MAAVVVHAEVLPSRLDDLFGADGGAHIRPRAMGRGRSADSLARTGIAVEGMNDGLRHRWHDRQEQAQDKHIEKCFFHIIHRVNLPN
jgi:hypothetical protein